MKEYRKTPWMNPKIAIRQSSVHGRGMFATARILKGETVAIWGGSYVGKEEAEEARKDPDNRIQQIDDDVFEVFSYKNRGNDPTHFHNHSCNPNTWMEDEVTLSARFDIRAEEELTIDYAMFETYEDYVIIEKCMCGSQKCRGRITGKDWRLAELQERYMGHFLPMINHRISRQNNRNAALP